jgi:ADP-heptose:LPS heptosyltransferase
VVSLRAAGLGDLLTAVPALRAVRTAHPDAHHVLATSPRLLGVEPILDAVDRVVPTEVRPASLSAPASAAWPLPWNAPLLAVNLHGRGPESHRLLQSCRPGSLVAYADDTAGVDGPRWDPDEHEVARWCRLVDSATMPADPTDLDVVPPPGPVAAGVRGATLLHAGAAWPARRWPVDRWVALADAEVAEGHRVVVTAGAGERSLATAITDRVRGVTAVDCGDDLGLLLRTVAVARVVVSGDTGVAHVATAVRTPSVVLFGPEPPSRWGPPADRPWHVALWSGRRGDPRGLSVDPGLLEIEVVDVLLALRRVRDRFASGSAHGMEPTCAS